MSETFEGVGGDVTYVEQQRFRVANTPSDFGFLEWTYPIDLTSGVSTIASSGVIQSAQIKINAPNVAWGETTGGITIATMSVIVQTAGSTLTASQCGMALYSPSRVLLGSTFANTAATDLHTAFASTGLVSGTLTAATGQSLAGLANGTYFVAISQVGTTPAIFRGTGTVNVNGLLAASASRYATNDTMTTAFPTTLGTSSAYNGTFWVGLS
ncbi:MAG: hypothetical protein WB777_14265 [Mycobacterium sp.]